LGQEERARFDAQIASEHEKILGIGRQRLAWQAIPIGNPDPAPKRQYQKRKSHGKVDTRGLTGAELAGKDLPQREAAARNRIAITPQPEEEDGLVLVPDSPRRLEGTSQGGTSIPLATRLSPNRPRASPPSAASSFGLPASTAPPPQA
jgi:hypothetical protein